MQNERKAIRDAITEVLASSLNCPVFSGRSIDGRELSEFVNVYITEGEVFSEGLGQRTEASVLISYRSVHDLTDDELDEKSEPIVELIESHDFGGVMQGIVAAGFEYLDERERGYDGITLRYLVAF